MEPEARGAGARDWLAWGARRLDEAGIAASLSESEWMLGHLLGCGRSALYLHAAGIDESTAGSFRDLVRDRCLGRPLQYLLGEAEFFGRRFKVEPGVFIPRPETERLVETVLSALRGRFEAGRPLRILELGTGSGCVPVTLAAELPACVVVTVDVSYLALKIAKANAEAHHVSSRMLFMRGRWADALRWRADAVVSNPPYVPSAELDSLPNEVKQEPRESLDGGPDGTRDLLHLIREAPSLLEPRGVLALECGEDQVDLLLRAARGSGRFAAGEAWQDLGGRPRGVLLRSGEGLRSQDAGANRQQGA